MLFESYGHRLIEIAKVNDAYITTNMLYLGPSVEKIPHGYGLAYGF